MEKLHNDFFTATESVRQQLITKQAELRAELVGSKPNPQKVEQLSTEIGALRGKMMNARIALEDKLEEAGIPAGGMGPCAQNGNDGCGCGYGGGRGMGRGGMMGHGGMMGGGGMMGNGGMGCQGND